MYQLDNYGLLVQCNNYATIKKEAKNDNISNYDTSLSVQKRVSIGFVP